MTGLLSLKTDLFFFFLLIAGWTVPSTAVGRNEGDNGCMDGESCLKVERYVDAE